MTNESSIKQFLSKLKGKDDFILNIDPKLADGTARTIYDSEDANIVICATLDQLNSLKLSGKSVAYYKKVMSNHRSEEHTSELQSRQYLVCRLLLEKKKKYA